jgi:hypothetical protein
MLNSTGRILWFWGALSVLALLVWKPRGWKPLVAAAFLWIGITLLPFSFLTYMPRIPSRHTYWPSLGVAFLVGAAFLAARERWRTTRPWAPMALASAIILHTCGYLGLVKHQQYVERAAPTERLLAFARTVKGPIYLECFPYGPETAMYSLQIVLNRSPKEVVYEPAKAQGLSNRFCYDGPLMPASRLAHRGPADRARQEARLAAQFEIHLAQLVGRAAVQGSEVGGDLIAPRQHLAETLLERLVLHDVGGFPNRIEKPC